MGVLRTFGLAAGLGIMAGMRTMSAPAVVSRRLAQHPDVTQTVSLRYNLKN